MALLNTWPIQAVKIRTYGCTSTTTSVLTFSLIQQNRDSNFNHLLH